MENNLMLSDIKSLIENSNGKIFGVEFIKKDGSVRKMQARLGVKSYLKTSDGRASTTVHIPEYLTVFDMENKGYRTINVSTLKRLSLEGRHYNFP